MAIGNLFTAKELGQGYQPLLLAEFTFPSGSILRYSTHPLSTTYGGSPSSGSYEYSGHEWLPRIVGQDLGPIAAMSDIGVDVVPQVSIILADPDKGTYNGLESSQGFKGAELRLYLVLFDAGDSTTGSFSSNSPPPVKFIGTCEAPSADDRTITIVATSLLNMTQRQFPPLRLQPLCNNSFPITDDDMAEGLADNSSPFSRCGYSPGLFGGVGNFASGSTPFRFCHYDFASCIERLGNTSGVIPIERDTSGNYTGRFGGYRYIPNPNSGTQRPYITGKWEQIVNASNQAKYGDFVPMVYGQTWVEPEVMGIYGDGNYTGFELLLGSGRLGGFTIGIEGDVYFNDIHKVVVNGQEIQQISSDAARNKFLSDSVTPEFKNGFWQTLNNGSKNGQTNSAAGWGNKGDPYGSVGAIYCNVLRQAAAESSIPQVQVLVSGAQVRVYSSTSTYVMYPSQNPAWILLDVLVRAGWSYGDIDIQSFIDAASRCDHQTYFTRMDGVYTNVYNESGSPAYRTYQVGFCVRSQSAIGDVVRGLRNAMKAILFFDYNTGLLKTVVKETFASQQSAPIVGSNYNTPVPSVTVDGLSADGYAAYKFDHTNIIKSDDGKLQIKTRQRSNQESPNKTTVVFQNRENGFSQDSATIVDTEDVSRLGFEVFGSFSVLGPQTFDHVLRVTNTWYAENYRGNGRLDYVGSAIGDTGGTTIFTVQTTVKVAHLAVGQLCIISDPQSGIVNQPVRVMSIKPAMNFETALVELTWHNDNWYQLSFGSVTQPKYSRIQKLVDRPPFPWRPDYETPISGDPYYGSTDKGFGVLPSYGVDAQGNALATLRLIGNVPINSFPDTPGRPRIEILGSGTTGGGFPVSKTYYVALAAVANSTTSSPISALSNPAAITLSGGQNALSIKVQDWPDSPSGYVAYAGLTPFTMTEQYRSTANPTTVTFTNTYNEAAEGPPDEAFSLFNFKLNRNVHGGIWGQGIVSATTASLKISIGASGFTSNQFAGREVSVFGIQPSTATPNFPLATFQVSGNTTDTLILSSGNPLTCVQGGPLRLGDVVVMRYKPTFGHDSIGYYFEDSLFVNALEPTGMIPGGEVNRLVFVIAGTGRGTYASIVANTTTRVYISGSWPVPPDSTTRVIIIDESPLIDIDSGVINNAVEDIPSSYDINVTNFLSQSLLVRVGTRSTNGAKSLAASDPFREMYLWGGQGIRTITASATQLATDGTILVDSTSGVVTLTCLSARSVLNQTLTVVLIAGSNVVTINPAAGESFDDGSTSVTLSTTNPTAILKFHG